MIESDIEARLYALEVKTKNMEMLSADLKERLENLDERIENMRTSTGTLKEEIENLEELLNDSSHSDPVVKSIPVIFDADDQPENEIISDLLKQAKELYPQPVVFQGYLTPNAVAYLQHSCSVTCIVDPATMENVYRIKYEMGN